MAIPVNPPDASNFGISMATLERTPEAFFQRHREALLVVCAATALVAGGIVVFIGTRSAAASLYFVPILVAVSCILGVPVAMVCLHGAGALETWWRSRVDPTFAACARYRRAREDFRSSQQSDAGRDPRRRAAHWMMLDAKQLVDEVAAVFGADRVTVTDKEATGIDLVASSATTPIAIRCETDLGRATGAGIVRELRSVLADSCFEAAILVSPAGISPELVHHLENTPISALDAPALAAGELDKRIS